MCPFPAISCTRISHSNVPRRELSSKDLSQYTEINHRSWGQEGKLRDGMILVFTVFLEFCLFFITHRGKVREKDKKGKQTTLKQKSEIKSIDVWLLTPTAS